MESAIADISVTVNNYQIPVPEHYCSYLLLEQSSSQFQLSFDGLKRYVLMDSAFLEALMEEMRIKITLPEIHSQQREPEDSRTDCQEQERKRKDIEVKDAAEPTNRQTKKMKKTTRDDDSDNECANNEEEEDEYGAEMSEHDDTLTVSSEDTKDNQEDGQHSISIKEKEVYEKEQEQSSVAEVPAHKQTAGKISIEQKENLNDDCVYSEASENPSSAQQRKGKIGVRFTSWMKYYGALMYYRDMHGDCRVPTNYPPNQRLAHWVNKVRVDGRKFLEGRPNCVMNAERFRMLEDVDFNWYVQKFPWEEFLSMLHSFKHKYGHCKVPRKWDENVQLGVMARIVRQECERYRKELRTELVTSDRIKTLIDIGFIGWADYRHAISWMKVP